MDSELRDALYALLDLADEAADALIGDKTHEDLSDDLAEAAERVREAM